jgi:hypothetical protein
MKVSLTDPRLLKPNPWNSNRVAPENMQKLRSSIRELGFSSAVVVRTLPSGDLQILGGQHRTEAAIAEDLETIPILNLGKISDDKAMKIGLIDNHRYGNDDTIALAKIYELIGDNVIDLTKILPVSNADIESVLGMINIDLDAIGLTPDDDEDEDKHDKPKERPAKTHDVLKFRCRLGDAEKIRALIEKTIRRQKFEDQDDMTSAGEALSFLLLSDPE